jgi:plasmid stabilization system protein ParE
MASFRLTPDAIDDLDAIWSFIFKDNPDAGARKQAT